MNNNLKFQVTYYIVERKDTSSERFLVYGRSVPIDDGLYIDNGTEGRESKIQLTENDDINKWVPLNLIIYSKIIDKEEHDEIIKNLKNGKFDFKTNEDDGIIRAVRVIPRPNVIQYDADTLSFRRESKCLESGLHSVVYIESFWQMDKKRLFEDALNPLPSDLSGVLDANGKNGDVITEEDPILILLADKELDSRFKILTHEMRKLTGLSFNGAYSERLGNFEVLSIPLDMPTHQQPFSVQVYKEERKDNLPLSFGIIIERASSLLHKRFWAHVVLHNASDIILDSLVLLERGQESQIIRANEVMSGFEVRIFDENPNCSILYAKSRHLIRAVNISMRIISGTKKYQDRLSQCLVNAKKSIGNELEEASSFTNSPITVSDEFQRDPWVIEARLMKKWADSSSTNSQYSKWFPRSIDDQGNVIKYIREIIDDSQNKEVMIVDPFFGITAFGKLIPRLQNSNLKVTILTSCLGFDPDKEERGGRDGRCNDVERVSADQREKLKEWCSQNKAFIEVNLKILDVRCGKDQAFHDRYIVCIKVDGDITIYTLSNSLNKMAGYYPCLITRLEPAISKQIYRYLKGLELGQDLEVQKGASAKNIDRELIWESQKGFGPQGRAQARPKLWENGPDYFPFWHETIRWIFPDFESSCDPLPKILEKKGITNNNGDWDFKESFFNLVLNHLEKGLPENIENQAFILAGLGEILARTNNMPADFETLVVEKLRGSNVYSKGILSYLHEKYGNIPSPNGYMNIAPGKKELSCAHLFYESNISFSLLKTAESLLEYHYEQYTVGLYGLKWSIKLLLKAEPGRTVECLDQVTGELPHLCAAIISAIVNLIITPQNVDLVNNLLKSNKPILKMLGAASIFRDRNGNWNTSMEILKSAGFSHEDIIWISALPVSEAQSSEFRMAEQRTDQENLEKTSKNLQNLLKNISMILKDSNPIESQLEDLDRALRSSTRDWYSMAEYTEQNAGGESFPLIKKLFQKCVDDIEVLIGKRGNKEFHFYDKTDFEKLKAGAKAFVKLNENDTARKWRNRFKHYLDNLSQIASDPFAKTADYSSWSDKVGQLAAGVIFGYQICAIARESDITEFINETFTHLLSLSCRLQIGAGMGWYDISGLMDKVSTESAWNLELFKSEASLRIASYAADDDRLPPFFRASLSAVPLEIFKKSPDRAMNLLKNFLNAEDHRNISRYFCLLDFIIGNSYKAKFPKELFGDAIQKGLQVYPISDVWSLFFNNIWDALSGNKTKKEKILCEEKTKVFYCAWLLQRD